MLLQCSVAAAVSFSVSYLGALSSAIRCFGFLSVLVKLNSKIKRYFISESPCCSLKGPMSTASFQLHIEAFRVSYSNLVLVLVCFPLITVQSHYTWPPLAFVYGRIFSVFQFFLSCL